MKRGFSLIELVVVIALIAILVSTSSVGIRKIQEKRMVERAKTEVAEMMSVYTNRSYHEGEMYRLQVDGAAKVMEAYDSDGVLAGRVELPDKLEYNISGDGVTTQDGLYILKTGVDDSDSNPVKYGDSYMEIEDYSGNAVYSIGLIKSEKTGLVRVIVDEEN